MKTTTLGNQAEQTVAEELNRQGYKILDRNWKTKVCEIDIVASKERVVYFVEVKFRSGQAQGSGLEYIGPQKLRRMHFAAEVWVQAHKYDGDYTLLAASVMCDGLNFIVEDVLEVAL